MTLWARLTWQAKDPDALAAELSARLGVPARPGGLVTGAQLLDLGTALLEVRPWVREGPADHPRAAGRLLLEPVPGGEEPPAGGTPGGPTAPAVVLVGVGWATVEADRAERELELWLGPRAGDEGEDPQLGARTRLHGGAGLPGPWMVILEPATEGRAAASLARDGEGPCALWLRPVAGLEAGIARVRATGTAVTRRRDGPFGPQVLVHGAAAGPHVILTEGRPPVSAGSVAGTIAP